MNFGRKVFWILQPNRNELLLENIQAIRNRVTSLGNTLDTLVKAHDRVGNQALAVQNQMMASKMQGIYSQVQHIVQDNSPTIRR
ncbi:MAG: hypothetical protein ACQEXX_27135 [Bacillota bacterium]